MVEISKWERQGGNGGKIGNLKLGGDGDLGGGGR